MMRTISILSTVKRVDKSQAKTNEHSIDTMDYVS